MKRRAERSAFTILELMVICAVIAMIGLAVLGLNKTKARAIQISCVNNVKQCELASMVWAGDNNEKYPMEISTNAGGTLEFVSGTNTFRYFQVMSNELSTPKVACCPGDTRRSGTNFGGDFNNERVSYFIGVDASRTNRQMWLLGDRNITNGFPPAQGVLMLDPSRPTEWTREMHKGRGNVAFSGGGVEMMSSKYLRDSLKKVTGLTNRIGLPE